MRTLFQIHCRRSEKSTHILNDPIYHTHPQTEPAYPLVNTSIDLQKYCSECPTQYQSCTRVQKPTSKYSLSQLRVTLLDYSTFTFPKRSVHIPSLHSLLLSHTIQEYHMEQYSSYFQLNPRMYKLLCTIIDHKCYHTITSFLVPLRGSIC